MPPTSSKVANQLIRNSIPLEKADAGSEKCHTLFMSHNSVDKLFVRRPRKDLLTHGMRRVWVNEAEIKIGDSLTAKIEEGMKLSRYIAVVLSEGRSRHPV